MPLTFNPNKTAFDADNASDVASDGLDVAQTRVADELGLIADFEFFYTTHPNFDTYAFAAATETHAVLSFRGTDPKDLKIR